MTISPPAPPRTPGLPLLGSAVAAYRDPVAFLLKQYRVRGPVFRFRAGFHDFDVIAGPGANALVQDDRGERLRSEAFWAPILRELGASHALMSLDGPAHREMRRVLAPTMTRTVVERSLAAMTMIVRETFEPVRAGDTVPLVGFARLLVSKQVASLLAGRGLEHAEVAAVLNTIEAAFVRGGVLGLPPWLRVVRGPQRRADARAARALARRLLAETREPPGNGPDADLYGARVLELAARFPDLFTEGDLELAMLLPLFLGVPTMGETLVFAIWELLRRPDLLERVRVEVDEAFTDGPHSVPTVEAFRAMDDLRGFVLETLRLHPTAFGAVRRAVEDIEFSGRRIAAGRDVFVFATACHFLDEHFPDAARFDIDRYRPPRDEHRRPNVFTPFGRGPHACLGAGLGESLLMIDLASIVRLFDLELVDPGRTWRPVLAPTPSLGPRFEIRLVGRR